MFNFSNVLLYYKQAERIAISFEKNNKNRQFFHKQSDSEVTDCMKNGYFRGVKQTSRIYNCVIIYILK